MPAAPPLFDKDDNAVALTYDDAKIFHQTVVHCPSEEMIADFFTKPIQGKIFSDLRSVIMGESFL
jgi:hypothetical protein